MLIHSVDPAVDSTVLWLICLKRQLSRRRQFVASNWHDSFRVNFISYDTFSLLLWNFNTRLHLWWRVKIELIAERLWLIVNRENSSQCLFQLTTRPPKTYAVHKRLTWWSMRVVVGHCMEVITFSMCNLILCNFDPSKKFYADFPINF